MDAKAMEQLLVAMEERLLASQEASKQALMASQRDLKAGQDELRAEVAKLRKDMDNTTTKVGELWEAEVRRKMAGVHGTAFVQSEMVRGLDGAVNFAQPCGANHARP